MVKKFGCSVGNIPDEDGLGEKMRQRREIMIEKTERKRTGIVKKAIQFGDNAVEIVHELKNIDTGEWEGYHGFIVDRKEFEAMKKLFGVSK